MKVRNVRSDAVDIDLRGVEFDDPGLRVTVEPGEVIDVPDEIALGVPGVERDDGSMTAGYGGLLDQPANWEEVKAPKAKKPDDNTTPDRANTGGKD